MAKDDRPTIRFGLDCELKSVRLDELKQRVQKNLKKGIRIISLDLKQAGKKAVRKSVARPKGKKRKLTLESPKGEIKTRPETFIKGKRIVVAGGGRGGRRALRPEDVKNTAEHRWNKSSRPGEAPISHPANQPGWTDNWLYNSIYTDYNEASGTIWLFSRPDIKGGPRGMEERQLMPKMLEEGGSYSWQRQFLDGYTFTTVSRKIRVTRGDGSTIAGKKETVLRKRRSGKPVKARKVWRGDLGGVRKDGSARAGFTRKGRWVWRDDKKNRSGRTQKAHYRKWKEPRVDLRKRFTRMKKITQMAARPFLSKAVEKFFAVDLQKALGNLLEE